MVLVTPSSIAEHSRHNPTHRQHHITSHHITHTQRETQTQIHFFFFFFFKSFSRSTPNFTTFYHFYSQTKHSKAIFTHIFYLLAPSRTFPYSWLISAAPSEAQHSIAPSKHVFGHRIVKNRPIFKLFAAFSSELTGTHEPLWTKVRTING